jgi:DNA-binding transcriptional ArsR family regulator
MRLDELQSLRSKLGKLRDERKFITFKKLINALSHTTRLEILFAINYGVSCPCELEFITGLAQATVSHHLSILEDAGLVSRNKKGKWTILSPKDQPLLERIFNFNIPT